MASEFDLIRRHFTHASRHTDLAVGDDGALMTPSVGTQLVVSTDMLVAGTHFLSDTDPACLGWKTAAVNISDMAAMGAMPRWMFLALALPTPDEPWIAAFAEGFASCCKAFTVDWAGGDTTRGPLNLCATVIGEVASGSAILREGASIEDDIWVSGMPGLAALGLRHVRDGLPLDEQWREPCLNALHLPQPRVALGLNLHGVASAMLDVSDGLLGDLAHILERSLLGAELEEAALPIAPPFAACGNAEIACEALFGGGDDYELLFTARPAQRATIAALAARLGLPITRIGHCTETRGMRLLRRDGSMRDLPAFGFDHFA